MQEKIVMKGIVKWFSSEKGYGFISCDGIDNDVYVHFSEIQMRGFKTLDENDKVEFEYDEENQKAINVHKILSEQSNIETSTDSE